MPRCFQQPRLAVPGSVPAALSSSQQLWAALSSTALPPEPPFCTAPPREGAGAAGRASCSERGAGWRTLLGTGAMPGAAGGTCRRGLSRESAFRPPPLAPREQRTLPALGAPCERGGKELPAPAPPLAFPVSSSFSINFYLQRHPEVFRDN